MDVSCPQCDTLYELDGDQVRDRVVTLKCSHCGHLFRLESDRGILDESQRRWMVRHDDTGDILYFSGFDTLHQWIMEGRIQAADAISRTGKSWMPLRQIGEFRPIFQVVDSIAEVSSAQSDGESATGEGPPREENTAPRYRPASADEHSTPSPAPSPRRRRDTGGASSKADSGATKRPRKQTEPQFRSASGEGPVVNPAGEEPARPRRRPNRAIQPTVPGRPGNVEEAKKRLAEQREHRDSTPEGPGKHRQVNLGDPRFQRGSQESSPEVADEQSLGEMEFGTPEKPDSEFSIPRRSRWPVVVFLMVVAVGGILFWQRHTLEELITSPSDEEMEVGTGESVDEESADSGESVTLAQTSVYESVDAARTAQRAVVTAEAIAEARAYVGSAIEDGVQRSSRAVRPSADDLIAAGRRSLDRGNPGQARDRFLAALEESPNHSGAIIGLGWADLAANDHEAAVHQFNRALRTDPSAGEALIGIGRAERDRGRPAQALQAYREYLERFPDGSQASIARYQSQQLERSLE